MPRLCRPRKAAGSESGMMDGDDERRAQVAEEEEQHERHQQRAFEQVVADRLEACADQPGAIVERHDCAPSSAAGRSAGRPARAARRAPARGFRPCASARCRWTSSSSPMRTMPCRGPEPMVTVGDLLHQHRHAVARPPRCCRSRRRSGAGRCRGSGTAGGPARCSRPRRWRCRGGAPWSAACEARAL